jgi:hypothetical protein
MSRIDDILAAARSNPKNVKFSDICKVCDYFFGEPRQNSTSHRVYKTPWQGDPRVNIQNKNGKAKPYQVKQVLNAVDKMVKEHGK